MNGIQHFPGFDDGRPETGVMQFGDDWPGVFIRGDNAMHYAMVLRFALQRMGHGHALEKSILKGLADLLASSRVSPSPPAPGRE